jgi:hypothetical protein
MQRFRFLVTMASSPPPASSPSIASHQTLQTSTYWTWVSSMHFSQRIGFMLRRPVWISLTWCRRPTRSTHKRRSTGSSSATLQSIYDSIIIAHGDNQYTITHMGKDKMEREGTLPMCLKVTLAALASIRENVTEKNSSD